MTGVLSTRPWALERGYIAIVAVGAVAYAVLGQLWIVLAHRDPELLFTSGDLRLGFLVVGGVVLTLSASLAARRSRHRWARWTAGTAAGGLLGGLFLYRLAERLWWPDLHFGCRAHWIPGAEGYERECLGYLPLYYFDPPFRHVAHLVLLAAAVLLAVLAGAIARRLGPGRSEPAKVREGTTVPT